MHNARGMRADHVDLLLQYALLRAGEEDSFRDRDLGPIHLLKYVYLGDLAYARKNHGETFTGAPWRFYHFGPWSQDVYQRIAPALAAIHARKFVGQSDFEDRPDWVRWSVTDSQRLRDVQRAVPPLITIDLDHLVHKFRKDTPLLLDHVYQTEPMLSAAPGETLDFSGEDQSARPAIVSGSTGPSATHQFETADETFDDLDALSLDERDLWDQVEDRMSYYLEPKLEMRTPFQGAAGLSVRETTRLREAAAEMRARFAASPGGGAERFVPQAAPTDEVHERGMAWLDGLAGQPLHTMNVTAEFSPEVWKSTARKGDDLP